MGKKRLNLIGQMFGRLSVIEEAGKNKRNQTLWKCQCMCGNQPVVIGGDLRSGNTKSCGCLHIEKLTTHGLYHHPLRPVYDNMKSRCLDKNNKTYKNYGGRGIKICERWINSLEAFIEDVYEGYEKGLELDRIDNEGDYEPNNVRWVTHKQNSRNRGANLKGTSKYKGVCWYVRGEKWVAQISVNGKKVSLGYFNEEDKAAEAYNEAAIKFFGEFAYLNVIEKGGGNVS